MLSSPRPTTGRGTTRHSRPIQNEPQHCDSTRKYTQHQVVRYFATSHLSHTSIASRPARCNRILRSMPSLSYSQVPHDTACAFNALQFHPHYTSAHSSTKQTPSLRGALRFERTLSVCCCCNMAEHVSQGAAALYIS